MIDRIGGGGYRYRVPPVSKPSNVGDKRKETAERVRDAQEAQKRGKQGGGLDITV